MTEYYTAEKNKERMKIIKTYYLIDYEWTFDFPIPVKYVIYRIIHYYIECNSIRKKIKEN